MTELMNQSAKTLLIVYHTQSGNTERLAKAVAQGARRIHGIRVRTARAGRVSAEDLTSCGALIICSPEYFGYMAGAIKDLFDRTYEEIRDSAAGKSYTVVICAGNDGTGALTSIERIVAGYRLKRVQDPVVCRGGVTESDLERCRELGQTIAAGLELGIY
ncbi:MAG: NAD(P)H-dependent oxidoreductase [Desulfomonilaceae bacterium]|nr:NAD(P)H-dependent oxidoreductase [Desulfomonilaceae bacterium]